MKQQRLEFLVSPQWAPRRTQHQVRGGELNQTSKIRYVEYNHTQDKWTRVSVSFRRE